ncbi:MAG: hypothetical protein CL862_01860 [Cyanobium sp. NAT70]|jgi:prepilin-type N-terminal cleavage/methylation domain-containing protein|nr:hypothetical protein [Cyanobium sp. NAT70]|tara:strand:+ start:1584 stop:2039 length:456 start_codon:yes stop_codon:yes gene_type:complete
MKDRIGKNQSSHQSGFSLVEVLIAAVVMFFLLAGTNRMLVLAMASSSSSGIRMEIENQILNDIEEIQAIDTSLNNNPPCDEDGTDSAILKDKVESMRPVSTQAQWSRDLSDEEADLLRVIYHFTPPESTGGTELRLIELNPSFSTACPEAS